VAGDRAVEENGPEMGLRRARVVVGTVAVALAALHAAAAGAAAPKKFPKGFAWGTAISGFQTEAGGRPSHVDRRSDWYRWATTPENVARGIVSGDRPSRGPGFWRRYRSDFRLAKNTLHTTVLRTSIEWSRIFPRSTRKVRVGARVDLRELRQLDALADRRAVRHYRSILVAARHRGLRPLITVNHFSLPLWIHEPIGVRAAFAHKGLDDPVPRGLNHAGWLNADTAVEFGKYAAYLAWKFGPLVRLWNPINEPLVIASSGYLNIAPILAGNFPPGIASFPATIRVLRNLEAANRRAYDEIHRWDRRASVGLVQNMVAFTPADPASTADQRATNHANYLFNRLFIDAAVKGIYDDDLDAHVDPGEQRQNRAGKADFIGVNYYFRGRVKGLPQPLTPRIPVSDFQPAVGYRSPASPFAPPCPTECSDFGTEIYPAGLRDVLAIAGEYGLPVWITENGIADADDDQRARYLLDHLGVLRQAIADHVARVRGYLHWSLVDNFEWAAGYGMRFGLFAYDPDSLARTARPSAALYGRIARATALP
jgi:beta-galactosidase